MADKTGRQAGYQDKRNVVNKAYLIEPIIRHRIQDSIFYKQYLYLTNEATIIPIIIDKVRYIAGTDSIGRPSPFLCCLLRLLELDPNQEMLVVYELQMNFQEFKYLTSLILIYYRLTLKNHDVYNKLDRYYQDYRKLIMKLKSPRFNDKNLPINYELSYIDEWVDGLLTTDRIIDIKLPRLLPRLPLLEKNLVKPRQYHIEQENIGKNEHDEETQQTKPSGGGSDSSDYQSDSD